MEDAKRSGDDLGGNGGSVDTAVYLLMDDVSADDEEGGRSADGAYEGMKFIGMELTGRSAGLEIMIKS